MDTLVAATIHDAKNALLALDGQLALIGSSPGEAIPADLLSARARVGRIAAKLTELLTLYRAGNGQLRLTIDDHDLNDFLDDLLAELGPLPSGITLDLERQAADRLGAWAFDACLVRLALLDALRNCLRHARKTIRLALTASPEGGICFAVGDDGAGFPADLLAGNEPLQSSQGTGLGLTFVRLIAQRHATPDGRRGRVELRNDNGALLQLFLP